MIGREDRRARTRRRAAWRRREFTVYRTHHGPIVREANGKWVAVQHHAGAAEGAHAVVRTHEGEEPRQTFQQTSWTCTRTRRTTRSSPTPTATSRYFFTNFIPKRDPKFEWNRPVDGSDPATEWQGLLSNAEVPHVINPPSGWVYNSNDWPWDAAGKGSIDRASLSAVRRAEQRRGAARRARDPRARATRRTSRFSGLIDAAFDSYQPAFATAIPALVRAWDQLARHQRAEEKTAEQIALLRTWDFRWGVDCRFPTRWPCTAAAGGRRPRFGAGDARPRRPTPGAAGAERLAAASDKLTADFGTWKTPWGQINRFQRNDGNIVPAVRR